MTDFSLEQRALANGHHRVAGVDEVGRGPFAGPVLAAAVILDPANIPDGIRDSKKLNAGKRNVLADQIHKSAWVSIAQCTVAEIDTLNILHASMLAMKRALAGLTKQPDFALIDGNRVPAGLSFASTAVVRGDDKSVSIAAASIVAKVARDRLMADLAAEFPGYGWETNAGYGTKQHIQGLKRLGVTPHHRRSFKPIHNILYQQNN